LIIAILVHNALRCNTNEGVYQIALTSYVTQTALSLVAVWLEPYFTPVQRGSKK